MDEIISNNPVNKDQIYIMGLSMGAFGTFESLGRWPDKYAAAVAICGGGNADLALNYATNTSVWITHGAQDDVVPIELSQRIYTRLSALGADVKFTKFEDTYHNAWDSTFAIPELLPWLFSKSNKKNKN